jgi:hypothetical protein
MYLYGFMMPFCQNISKTQCNVECFAYWIIQILDLLHQLDHGLTFAVSNIRLLCHAKTVLSTDAAVPLLYPLIDPGFELLFNSLIKPAHRNIQVQVAITHVSVTHDVHHGVRVIFAHQASFGKAVARFVNKVV